MNNDAKMKRLEELLNNDTFLNELKTVSSVEAFQKKLKENGLDMTEDEVSQFCEDVLKLTDAQELDEEQLEKVSGGIIPLVAGAIIVVGGIAISYAAGWLVGRFFRNKSGICN